jgi:hypothetical protein
MLNLVTVSVAIVGIWISQCKLQGHLNYEKYLPDRSKHRASFNISDCRYLCICNRIYKYFDAVFEKCSKIILYEEVL